MIFFYIYRQRSNGAVQSICPHSIILKSTNLCGMAKLLSFVNCDVTSRNWNENGEMSSALPSVMFRRYFVMQHSTYLYCALVRGGSVRAAVSFYINFTLWRHSKQSLLCSQIWRYEGFIRKWRQLPGVPSHRLSMASLWLYGPRWHSARLTPGGNKTNPLKWCQIISEIYSSIDLKLLWIG